MRALIHHRILASLWRPCSRADRHLDGSSICFLRPWMACYLGYVGRSCRIILVSEGSEEAMRKKLIVVAIVLMVLLAFPMLNQQFCILKVAWCADSYGNDISYVEVWQYNGTAWNLVINFTSSGGSTRIHDSWTTKFIVMCKLNSTLASSQTEAKDYTKNLMNITYGSPITYVWQNKELNFTSCTGPTSGFYYIERWGNWTSDLPQQGVTYTCALDYQQYY